MYPLTRLNENKNSRNFGELHQKGPGNFNKLGVSNTAIPGFLAKIYLANFSQKIYIYQRMAKKRTEKKSLTFEPLHTTATFIGREFELERLEKILSSNNSNIIVLYGRRRVGKTELLHRALRSKKVLIFEGLENQPVSNQRQAFLDKLARYTGDIDIARLRLTSWRDVFGKLSEKLKDTHDCVIYLEELQWLANYRKDLVSDLKYVWDNHLRHIPKIKLILCGSASSFMVKRVLKSRALYSRAIHELPLEPFSLKESKQFLSHYSNFHVLQAYLLFGGIPEYLRYVKEYETPLTALRQEAFIPGGYFVSEFERVFISSLSKYELHKQVIKAFAKTNFYNRTQLAKKIGISPGGTFTSILEDLELIGLIDRIKPYRSGKCLYYLNDPYLNCYLKLIAPKLPKIKQGAYKGQRLEAVDLKGLSQYLGYAFERFCRQNHLAIAEILQIAGVDYTCGPYLVRSNGLGFQFDLVFDRKDRCLTLFEIKFKDGELSSKVIKEFENKLANFNVPKNYNIQKVLISGGSVSKSLKTAFYFDKIIQLKDLIDTCD